MTIVPDLDWLEKSNFRPFMDVTYIYRHKEFGGTILFHDLDGTYSNGWTYENGEVIYAVESLDVDPEDESLLRALACHMEPVYTTTISCNTWYSQAESGTFVAPMVAQTVCSSYTSVSMRQVCNDTGINLPYVPIPNNPPGYNGGSTSSGNTNTGGTTTTTSKAPKAQKIFRNSNMTAANWEKIEKMLDKICSSDLGKALYDAIVIALNGKTLAFEFINSNGSAFDYSAGKISLSMSMESNHLFHEMWHAYQAYQETSSSYTNSLMNQEIEARFAQFIYVRSLPEYSGSQWEDWYDNNPTYRSIADIGNFVDEKGNPQPGYGMSDVNGYLTQQRSNGIAGGPEYYLRMTDISYFRMSYNSQFNNFKNLRKLLGGR